MILFVPDSGTYVVCLSILVYFQLFLVWCYDCE